jgi:hypothetical protein
VFADDAVSGAEVSRLKNRQPGAPIVDADVFMMIPMMGLKHCWSMQGGREGEYFSALVIRTDDTGEIEQPCDHE